MADAHHNEYLAAVAHLHEQTPSASLPAVGDFVSGRSAGRCWSGYVVYAEPGRLTVDVGGAAVEVDPADITH
jgi:hypothetical protein